MHLNIFYFRYKLKDNTVNQDRMSAATISVQVTKEEALFSPDSLLKVNLMCRVML